MISVSHVICWHTLAFDFLLYQATNCIVHKNIANVRVQENSHCSVLHCTEHQITKAKLKNTLFYTCGDDSIRNCNNVGEGFPFSHGQE